MHETYRFLAQDRIDEHLREADAWRLARAARDAAPRPDLAARVRALFPHVGDQRPAPATTGRALADGAACRP
jgi:hypothetical protein